MNTGAELGHYYRIASVATCKKTPNRKK